MKIYLISQKVNNGYDTFDAFVVFAPNEDAARLVHKLDSASDLYGNWVKHPQDINVEYLGEAREGAEEGVILASFNAG